MSAPWRTGKENWLIFPWKTTFKQFLHLASGKDLSIIFVLKLVSCFISILLTKKSALKDETIKAKETTAALKCCQYGTFFKWNFYIFI